MTTSGDIKSAVAQLAPVDEAPPFTLGQLTWRRFKRHKMAIFGLVILVLLFIYSFGGGFIISEKYANYTETGLRLNPPSVAHPFGR